MLRASSDATGSSYRLDAITRGGEAGDGNIPHGALLVEFVDAAFGRNERTMAPLRAKIVDSLGEQALVDVCAVFANFQRMVRIAEGTGIPVDGIMLSLSSDFRSELGVDSFAGADRSRVSGPRRLLHRAIRPLLRRALPRLARSVSGES
jgi:hypothetical protein